MYEEAKTMCSTQIDKLIWVSFSLVHRFYIYCIEITQRDHYFHVDGMVLFSNFLNVYRLRWFRVCNMGRHFETESVTWPLWEARHSLGETQMYLKHNYGQYFAESKHWPSICNTICKSWRESEWSAIGTWSNPAHQEAFQFLDVIASKSDNLGRWERHATNTQED